MRKSEEYYVPRAVDEALYNHLALPLRLPGREDSDLGAIQDALLDRLIASAEALADCAKGDVARVLGVTAKSLKNSKATFVDGRLDHLALATQLEALQDGHFLAIHVQCQNAALFVHRTTS